MHKYYFLWKKVEVRSYLSSKQVDDLERRNVARCRKGRRERKGPRSGRQRTPVLARIARPKCILKLCAPNKCSFIQFITTKSNSLQNIYFSNGMRQCSLT